MSHDHLSALTNASNEAKQALATLDSAVKTAIDKATHRFAEIRNKVIHDFQALMTRHTNDLKGIDEEMKRTLQNVQKEQDNNKIMCDTFKQSLDGVRAKIIVMDKAIDCCKVDNNNDALEDADIKLYITLDALKSLRFQT